MNHFKYVVFDKIDLLKLEFNTNNLKSRSCAHLNLEKGMRNIYAHKIMLNQQINVKPLQASHIDVLEHMYINFSFKRRQFIKKGHSTSKNITSNLNKIANFHPNSM